MAELKGISLPRHLDNILNELKKTQSLYTLPARSFFRQDKRLDFSVDLYGRKAFTPLGPAAGPHTQMTQNIILSFLAGSRIIELKTIQVLDRLEISRPCIDMRNVGYNIEWSQELSLPDSLREYVKAWILIKIIEEKELLGYPKGDSFYNTIFDISVGYDLKGISSPRVSQWINSIRDARNIIDELMDRLPAQYNDLKSIPIPAQISDSVTLSTFHGCPAAEIEDIALYLIEEHNLNVIIKMNPTFLGFDFVSDLLYIRLGYTNISLNREAFENDLSFDEALSIMQRLRKTASKYNVTIGAKFTNTLVVNNTENIFKYKLRYLSGTPLYALAMNSLYKFRNEMGADFPVSFSGGIDRTNFADAVACNLVPVTTCSDILKKGGYGRLSAYMAFLKTAMEKRNARTIEEYILKYNSEDNSGSVAGAGQKNTKQIINSLNQNKRYHFINNKTLPKKTETKLAFFDCISCNICISVCPNAANFSLQTGRTGYQFQHYVFSEGKLQTEREEKFTLNKATQIGNIAEFCNDCGNCETFCPEEGAPFLIKPRFFLLNSTYREHSLLDGFVFLSANHIKGRLNGREYELRYLDAKEEYIFVFPEGEIRFDSENYIIASSFNQNVSEGQSIDCYPFHVLKLFYQAARNNRGVYPLSLLNNMSSI